MKIVQKPFNFQNRPQSGSKEYFINICTPQVFLIFLRIPFQQLPNNFQSPPFTILNSSRGSPSDSQNFHNKSYAHPIGNSQERRSITTKKDFKQEIYPYEKENIPTIKQEFAKIQQNLKEVMADISNGYVNDPLNDKLILILSSFRKLESQIPDDSCKKNLELEKKIKVMTEDYTKLKSIMDNLQNKMTVLVQENQKLNKHVMEYEQQIYDQKQGYESEINKLKQQLMEKDRSSSLTSFQSCSAFKQQGKTDQSDLKLIQLQIENENLKSEIAHKQIDSHAMEQRKEMITKLEERVRQLLGEKQQENENFKYMLEEQKKRLERQFESEFSSQKSKFEMDKQNEVERQKQDAKRTIDKLSNLMDQQNLELQQSNQQIEQMRQNEQKLNEEWRKKYECIVDEMSELKEQYEIQKSIQVENNAELERKIKQTKESQAEKIEILQKDLNDMTVYNNQIENKLKQLENKFNKCNYDWDLKENEYLNHFNEKEEQLKMEKYNNNNLQDELLKNGIVMNQYQNQISTMKNELQNLRTELSYSFEIIKKRKEENEEQSRIIDEIKKENSKRSIMDDGRKFILQKSLY